MLKDALEVAGEGAGEVLDVDADGDVDPGRGADCREPVERLLNRIKQSLDSGDRSSRAGARGAASRCAQIRGCESVLATTGRMGFRHLLECRVPRDCGNAGFHAVS
jgi:hypothetical protein